MEAYQKQATMWHITKKIRMKKSRRSKPTPIFSTSFRYFTSLLRSFTIFSIRTNLNVTSAIEGDSRSYLVILTRR